MVTAKGVSNQCRFMSSKCVTKIRIHMPNGACYQGLVLQYANLHILQFFVIKFDNAFWRKQLQIHLNWFVSGLSATRQLPHLISPLGSNTTSVLFHIIACHCPKMMYCQPHCSTNNQFEIHSGSNERNSIIKSMHMLTHLPHQPSGAWTAVFREN